MTTKTISAAIRKIIAAVLGIAGAVAVIVALVLFDSVAYAASERYDVTSTKKSISSGVTETEYYTNSLSNDDQVVTYAIDIDLSQGTLIAGYKDYNSTGKWGMATVREQAAAAEEARNLKVVAAVNADFYNMGTGEPSGSLVMNGTVVKNSGGNYFAILKDGTAVIRSGSLRGDEQEVIGGSTIMIENGEIAAMSGDYDTTKYPRTAVGVKADGNVLIMVADGRQAPYSTGYTLSELANKMLELGCVSAINLDGGGSTTYLAKYAGSDELELANSPSDGQERSVSSSLLVVSYAEQTGVFGSAVISPENEVYTPGSEIDFKAIGADTAGFAVDVPDGVVWRLSDEDADKGEIVEIEAEEGTSAARFAAVEGLEGDVTVELVYKDEVVGTATVELRWPDKLTMQSGAFSLDFGERTDFGLSASWMTREVHLKAGDLIWNIGPTGDDKYPSIGQMDGDIFVADSEATNVTATVTASLAHNSLINASAEVSVGQLPTVVWDFEDVVNEEGEVVYTAEEYYTTGEGGRFIVSTVSAAGGTAYGSAQIVDAKAGEVRVGQHALQLNYDFTQALPTAGVYFGPSEKVAIPGHPTGLGVWIYVPEGTPNFWLRGYFTGTNEDGSQAPGNAWGNNYVVDFTKSTDEPLSEGWHYIEADFSSFTSPAYTYYLGTQTFRIMYLTSNGTASSGFIYLDNFQFVYGANTDDLNAPEINSVRLGSASGAEVSDGMTISEDPFSLYVSYNEYEEMYATGINTADVHVYVDGNEVELADATELELWTKNISLPDGKHKITVEINDNFQNSVSRTFTINVSNDKEYASVYIKSGDNLPYLGADYSMELIAEQPDKVDMITFEIRLATGLTLSYSDVADGFEVTECDLVHVNNNIYRVTVQRLKSYAQTYSSAAALLTLKVHCPTDLNEGSMLTYSVESSEVIYADGFQNTISNSFYEENVGVEIESYYTISSDIMVVGSAGGYIYVKTPEGLPAENVTVTIDGEVAGTTDAEGKLFTASFVGAACTKTVAAYSDKGYSYGQRISGVLAGGSVDEFGAPSAVPAYLRSVATVNGDTEQRLVWLSNPLAAKNAAIIKFATAADYAENGESAFVEYSGKSLLMEFTGTYAVYINQVLVKGLKSDTDYVYVAGDGVVWSEVHNFSTTKKNGTTNFIVMGDTQADDSDVFKAYGNAITSSGINYDFAIQTGDFVDTGSDYVLWSDILSRFSQQFADIDFVQVFGNHEYEGNEDGRYPEAMNFVPGEKYYSVTYGNVYVAVINCYTVSDMNEAVEWIKADAANSDAVWKVLTLHRPPYYTNAIGGSETSHNLIPALVDEAGFNVVFSGHDHSYARTEPMTGGEVDEQNGAVYFIVGAAEAGGKYAITDNPDFHFVQARGDFNALYFSVSAGNTEMNITVYNLTEDGGFEIFDTCTIRNSCYPDNHQYVYDTESGMLVCPDCYYAVAPEEISFSGFIATTNGRYVMFVAGNRVFDSWMNIGEYEYYFDKYGYAAEGEMTVESKYGDLFTFVFENGVVTGGDTGWTQGRTRYYENGIMAQGWREIDGTIYYFLTGNETADPDKMGYIATGAVLIKTPTVPYMTNYLIHFNEDGSFAHGDFHKTGENKWVYTRVRKPSDPDGIWVAYCYNQWVETEYGMYYAQMNSVLATGDYVVDGITYKFSEEGTDPESGYAKLLGRYYAVKFVSDGNTVSDLLIYQGEIAASPEEPFRQGNSIKSYKFIGWYNGDDQFEEGMPVTADITYTAKFETVYTEDYINFNSLLNALSKAKTPADKHDALNDVTAEYEKLSAAQIADMKAEGVSFALYEEMLSKLYEVKFVCDGQQMSVVTLYEGETILAPSDPSKSGNSIKSYSFAGWFSGDKQFRPGNTAIADITYTAKFNTEYTQTYSTVTKLLASLATAQTPVDKHVALDNMTAEFEKLTATEIADMKAEGVSFALYEEMLLKIYTVEFTYENEILGTAELYEGETIIAPKTPEKSGNSVKSYRFDGWYNGEEKFEAGMTAVADATFSAKFTAVYSDGFNAVKAALEALVEVSEGTLEQKYAALTAVYDSLKLLSSQQKTEAVEEGLSFEQYERMLEEYNQLAQSAEEDVRIAKTVADKLADAAAAIVALAAAAYVAMPKEIII